MYIWQVCFYWKANGAYHKRTILGRTWDQFEYLIKYMSDINGPDTKWCFYVHNLSFEFQFLAGVFTFNEKDVFCLDSRRLAKCYIMDRKIEVRCSYVLTNLSLEHFTASMGVKHKKLQGERFDYSRIRTPKTALTRYQLNYCIFDVEGLAEAIAERMKRFGDDLYTIPMTLTGYIRRVAKKELQAVRYNHRRRWHPAHDLKDEDRADKIRLQVYRAEREAFRGGNVHCNRFYTGCIIPGPFDSSPVVSVDRSSSYPEIILNATCPKNGLNPLGAQTLDQLIYKIKYNKMALLMRVAFQNLRLKDDYISMPYISYSKINNSFDLKEIAKKDNGRYMSTLDKDAWVDITITDIDLRIILDQYDFDDFLCVEAYGSVYGPFPEPIRQLAIKYYRAKTELKNVEGQEVYYQQSKELLNSLYGMMVQDPGKQSINFYDNKLLDETDPRTENGGFIPEKYDENELITKLRKQSKSGFLAYQQGLWVTAWARYELARGARIIREYYKDDCIDHLVYMDTDSLKFIIDNPDDLHMFDDYNNEKIELAKKNGGYATDPKGITHYMGVYEYEETYKRFVSWGAKKYAYEDKNGDIHITIAGVPKKKGAYQLQKAGGLEKLQPGFIFHDAGLDVVYNDNADFWYDLNGEKIHITRNTYLYTGQYEMKIAPDYDDTIQDAKILQIASMVLTETGIDNIF